MKKSNSIFSRIIRKFHDLFQWWWAKYIRLQTHFVCNKKTYAYNASHYNFSYANERSVEIPIFQKILATARKDSKILEVGNVLSHYQRVAHEIVDKYENGEGVINQDIAIFKTAKKYDLIISISTLEHVGWDEEKKDSKKILKSIRNLQSLLRKNGHIWFSVPLGYNSFLDKQIETNALNLKEYFFMKRITGFTNQWQQIAEDEAFGARYGSPHPHANVIMIART